MLNFSLAALVIAATLPRTAFSWEEPDGTVTQGGFVTANGTDLLFQAPGSFGTSPSTTVPQTALPGLEAALQKVYDDLTLDDGSTINNIGVDGTSIVISINSAGRQFGAYTLTSALQVQAHLEVVRAIRAALPAPTPAP